MNAISAQVQLKLSLSQQLISLLKAKADKLGVPVTQFVKHLLLREVEDETYPTFVASDWLEKKTKTALENKDKAVEVNNVHEFFQNL